MWNYRDGYCDKIREYTENVISQNGYPLEKYSVKTEDGYINLLYRIPHGKNEISDNNKSKPPVILCHALTCSSAAFVDVGSLGYYLADQGFDVWLPNHRGTTFSRKHTSWDHEKDNEKYWDFGWHEIAIYDNAAFVDYILKQTGFKKVIMIGHSQGATASAAFLSERPEYNEKVALTCMLGPPIIFENNPGIYPLKFITTILLCLQAIYTFFKLPICEMPGTQFLRVLVLSLRPRVLSDAVFKRLLFFLSGYSDYEQASEVDCKKCCITTPNSVSMRQAYHYSQIMRKRRFAKYDYGAKKNMKLYGSEIPPAYDLSKVTSPVAIFYGKNDMYTCRKDLDRLKQMMGNVVLDHEIECEYFNHADYIMARDAIPLLYSHMLKIMKKYTESS